MKLFSYIILSTVFGLMTYSCTEDGAMGPAGVDSTDGNANVQTYVYNNPTWNGSNWLDIDMNGILTDDVIENDAILGYMQITSISSLSISIPTYINSKFYETVIFNSQSASLAGVYRIISREQDGNSTPNANLEALDWVKIVVIESSNTTTGNGGKIINGKEAVYQELRDAGVDITDYDQVATYYGIE